jgi:hypothetical protein
MDIASRQDSLLTNADAMIPANNRMLPSIAASIIVIVPLGIGLSGLSILSNAASNTSLKTTPPPYKPIVEIHKNIAGKTPSAGKLVFIRNPDMAIPASTSDTEVTI